MGYYKRDSYWPEYVSVAEKKRQANKEVAKLKQKGITLNPVVIEGRTIAKTFWGKSWCENLESYSDYSNRLPRGRTYVRNGSVIDLQVLKGQIIAQVAGSSIYKICIDFKSMPEDKWQALVKACSGKIDSLIELLQGKFSKGVMEILTEKEGGLFPKPKEISMKCSCPDSATMCKHIAAVLYGIGAAIDEKPEYLFQLRHVDHCDLISSAGAETLGQDTSKESAFAEEDLSSLFGIEMESKEEKIPPTVKKSLGKKTAKKTTKKKTTKKTGF